MLRKATAFDRADEPIDLNRFPQSSMIHGQPHLGCAHTSPARAEHCSSAAFAISIASVVPGTE
jgi:hypothetical protein